MAKLSIATGHAMQIYNCLGQLILKILIKIILSSRQLSVRSE